MQERLDLAKLFVSHDLRVVRHLAHRVAVMCLGRVVEADEAEQVFEAPRHAYTQALLRAASSCRARCGSSLGARSIRAVRRRSTVAGSSGRRCSSGTDMPPRVIWPTSSLTVS